MMGERCNRASRDRSLLAFSCTHRRQTKSFELAFTQKVIFQYLHSLLCATPVSWHATTHKPCGLRGNVPHQSTRCMRLCRIPTTPTPAFACYSRQSFHSAKRLPTCLYLYSARLSPNRRCPFSMANCEGVAPVLSACWSTSSAPPCTTPHTKNQIF